MTALSRESDLRRKKRDQKKEEVRSMSARGKERKKSAPKSASKIVPKSYTILLTELAFKDRIISMQRDAIEALERIKK